MAEEKKQEDREEVKVDETVETETSEEKDTESASWKRSFRSLTTLKEVLRAWKRAKIHLHKGCR